MKVENELLLLCARTKLTKQNAERIRALAGQELDWGLLLQHVLYHKTFPLLYNSLKKVCPDMVPEAVLQQLKSYYMKNAAHSFFLAGMLIKILRIFEQNNIPAVPFKGPVLSETLFGNTGLRNYCDLDILIHQHDMYKAAHLLAEHGYQLDSALNESQFNKLIRTENQVQSYNEKNGVLVELHWELSGRYFSDPIDINFLHERLYSVMFLKDEVLQPSYEDLLVYLCIHGNQHYWEQLDAVCCIAELIQKKPGLDWQKAVEIAEKIGSKQMLFIGITLTHELLDTALPEKVFEQVTADKKIKKLSDQVTKSMFPENYNTENQLTSRRFVAWHLITMDQKLDSICYGLRLLTNPTKRDWEVFPLPANLAFLLYVLRPIRLMWEFSVGLAGKVR